MKELIKQILNFPLALIGKPATSEQLARTQQDLKINQIANIPQDYIEFLHYVNSLEYNGCFLFGINPRSYVLDIFSENLNIDYEKKQQILFLGYDDFDYLAFDCKNKKYQIIDKDSMEVIQTYKDLISALKYILKIEDDTQYF